MEDSAVGNTEQELSGIKRLLWGTNIKSDIFRRWSQGFYFSKAERSALEQSEGGPCAIIAPLQAFILKKLLLDYEGVTFRSAITEEIQNLVLINALCEVLQQCNVDKYYVVYLCDSHPATVAASAAAATALMNGEVATAKEVNESSPLTGVVGDVIVPTATTSATAAPTTPPSPTSVGSAVYDANVFHEALRIRKFGHLADVEKFYLDNVHVVKSQFGVLLFLYSVIATKGLEQVQMETDSTDPLIDETYGYGSQSLINLMITGRAVTYVWDNDQDVGGLKLRGIDKQSQVGFITLMEHLRYCTVGSFFKNPIHPIWVLGSDTHLTVLFSDEKKLVSPETRSEQARRVFKSFDPDGNNFISSVLLQDVLSSLDLVSDEAYVDIMRKKLDSENLGIILLNAFMDEFFPREESSTPDMFTLLHYNGLPQSNVNGQVQYHIGSAIMLECDVKSVSDSNPMLTCLQTKWPNIEINWRDGLIPSLN